MGDSSFGSLELIGESGRGVVFDRSRVRILVCDPSTSPDVLDLLRRCSYQVMAVQNARQVLEVLKTSMSEVDLILAEVELPKGRGFKMLKQITKEQRLKQIPIVMMSSRDEMAVVVKCLRLGAADYLVKPLRTNELLNLWTHMWRRRRMLGLAERHLISGNLNLSDSLLGILRSDTSESNNTSTDLLSEDSNDKLLSAQLDRASNLTNSQMNHSQNVVALELTLKPSSVDNSRTEQGSVPTAGLHGSALKKTELKIGRSSAFLSYTNFCNQVKARRVDRQSCYSQEINSHEHQKAVQTQATLVSRPSEDLVVSQVSSHWEPVNISFSAPNVREDKQAGGRSSDDWNSVEQLRAMYPPKQPSLIQVHAPNDNLPALSTPHLLSPGIVMPGLHSAALLQPALNLYQAMPQDHSLSLASGISPIHSLHLGPHHMPPPTFSYYSVALPVAHPPQVRVPPGWPAMPSLPVPEHKLEQAERREAALNKFRQKRKDRCFEKKIRYFSRKRLAEQRPRNRGQFVRRSHGVENGCRGEDSDEDDEDEDNGSNGVVTEVSPERFYDNSMSGYV